MKVRSEMADNLFYANEMLEAVGRLGHATPKASGSRVGQVDGRGWSSTR